ncbi:MAG: type II secretion system GspH family protein [Deltaproteobacteria bacterium]
MRNHKGFTILEIVVTLTLIAIVAAMVLPYLYTNFAQSGAPMWRLKDTLSLKQVMENITQDYNVTTLEALKISIGAAGTDQNNAYGQYHVVQNSFIKFTGNSEDTDTSPNLLKVTIANSKGEQLTTLFQKK